jgi:hypothetical protein
VADELRRQADVFVELEELVASIARNHTRPAAVGNDAATGTV